MTPARISGCRDVRIRRRGTSLATRCSVRRILLVCLLASCGSRAPAPVVGPPLGQSTAPGPRAPIYVPADASIVESAPLSHGAIVGALAPQPAAPAPAPTTPAPTTQGETPSGVEEPEPQPGVASPPPANPD